MAHIETPLHTQKEGKSIDYYFASHPQHFYGKCHVVKFENKNWVDKGSGVKQKEISLKELKSKIGQIQNLEKLLISVDSIDENEFGYHEPNDVLTLSLAAAEYLASLKSFNLIGTSWKSSDFMPGSAERPIHNELFKKALILEYINLNKVPEGEYFLNCFPLNLEGASEAPVTAVLFNKNELS